MLKDISLQTSNKAFQLQFNKTTCCITDLYLKCLVKYNTGVFKKIIVRVVSEDAKEIDSIEFMVDVIAITKRINFDLYFELSSNYDKKKLLLHILQEGIVTIAQNQNWEIDPLMDAYNSCINRNLENKWLRNDKFYLSTDKKYYGGVICCWDVDKFEAVVSFLNEKKLEIKQVKLFETEPHLVDSFGNMGWIKNMHKFFLESKNKRFKWAAEPE
jgi:hypothetical protein